MHSDSSTKASLPVLEFDWNDESIKDVAKNIYWAQGAGWPKVLTYDLVEERASRERERGRKRRCAMDREGVPRLKDERFNSRDEYPFTCTREHAGSVWVGHVQEAHNVKQGQMINAFLAAHGAYKLTKDDPPFRFEVRVKNYPKFNTKRKLVV